jgi:hypothetical protein
MALYKSLNRLKWKKWYTAIELIYSDTTTSAILTSNSANGNGVGSVNTQSVIVTNANNTFSLVLPHDVSSSVSVISYWTDRNLTNSGSTGNIAVWTRPQYFKLTTNSNTRTVNDGTQIQTTFTANYGGSGNSRVYIVQQTVDFTTVTGYPDSEDPLGIKVVQFSRRGGDASDTSNDSINCTGVYVYEN